MVGSQQSRADSVVTVFQDISANEGVRERIVTRGGDPVVVANNHYANGAYWLTWDLNLRPGEAATLDAQSFDKLDDYLEGKYVNSPYDVTAGAGGFTEPQRNDVPFSALTVWYLPGLDHEAHEHGMVAYRDYFINRTDGYIKRFVETLKRMGEFDNKIFVIVADHGHTEMAHPMYYKHPNSKLDIEADTSCEFKIKGFSKQSTQDAEKYNNNLHIWELAVRLPRFDGHPERLVKLSRGGVYDGGEEGAKVAQP